jgi:hypothetical protein
MMKVKARYSKIGLYLGLFIIAFYLSYLSYHHQFYKILEPSNQQPAELADIKVSAQSKYDGYIHFEASNIFLAGGLFQRGNYAMRLNRKTLEIETYKRFEAFGMGFERENKHIYSFYNYPTEIWQENPYNRVPFATGNYVLLNGNLGYLGQITDDRGIDNHSLTILENGNYLYMVDDKRPVYSDPSISCIPECYLLGQSIVEVTPSGETIFQFDLLDHYTRSDFVMDDIFLQDGKILYDVTHANSAELTADNAILISVRHQNEVIKASRETGQIVWRLGGHYSNFKFEGDSLNGFSHQHNPTQLDNGNILLFDNGNDRPGSRAVEYELDIEQGVARLVWQYSISPEFSPNRGSAQRLYNGNTLINFVNRIPNILEVSPGGKILLEISLPENYASYQAQYVRN